jgi:hypothetical protein
MATRQQEWTIGKSTFQFEAPDLLWVKHQGNCSLDEAIQMVNLYRELGRAHPFFILGDMEKAEGMEPEARRYLSEHLRPEWFLGAIYFRARLLHRAIAKGLSLAAALTRSKDDLPRTKVYFVSTRDRARELLAHLRAQQDEHHV